MFFKAESQLQGVLLDPIDTLSVNSDVRTKLLIVHNFLCVSLWSDLHISSFLIYFFLFLPLTSRGRCLLVLCTLHQYLEPCWTCTADVSQFIFVAAGSSFGLLLLLLLLWINVQPHVVVCLFLSAWILQQASVASGRVASFRCCDALKQKAVPLWTSAAAELHRGPGSVPQQVSRCPSHIDHMLTSFVVLVVSHERADEVTACWGSSCSCFHARRAVHAGIRPPRSLSRHTEQL